MVFKLLRAHMWMIYEYLEKNLEGEPRWELKKCPLGGAFCIYRHFDKLTKKCQKSHFLSKMSHPYQSDHNPFADVCQVPFGATRGERVLM